MTSILGGTDDRFEVLVVDDASTDETTSILERLEDAHERLRYITLPRDEGRHLGETRNISVREAAGDQVLLQLDADDEYGGGILDFIEVYEQLRDSFDEPFYLKGNGINVAPKEFLLERGPYRNLGVGAEDRDLWRRLLAAGEMVWLDHDPFYSEIGEGKDLQDRFRRDISVKTWEFQLGITVLSCVRWSLSERSPLLAVYDLLTYPYAFLKALPRTSFRTPEGFRKRGALDAAIEKQRGTLPDIESRYGVDIDRSALTEQGRTYFGKD